MRFEVCRLVGAWLVSWLVAWSVAWLLGCLAGRPADWLVSEVLV